MTDETINIIVNGEARPAAGGRSYPVSNPANPREIVGYAALAGEQDAIDAIEAAHAAFAGWSVLSYAERADYLRAINNRLTADTDELEQRIKLFTREHGKILREAGLELSRLGSRFEMCAAQADALASDTRLDGPPRDTLVTRHPRGVATLIVPWNWPLSILGAKLPQALITGNTVVVKLAEQCPLASLKTLGTVAAILPPGVMNVIASPPSEIGDVLITHPKVRKINFTGSIPAGKHIMRTAADTLKAITLELGGNDAALVLDDAELTDQSVRDMVMATFTTSGQVCMAIKRLYVHSSRYDELLEKFTTAADPIVVGDGLDPEVTMGPINNERQYEKVLGFIDDARERGATINEVGHIKDPAVYERGYFKRPTIVTDIGQDAPLVADEQFGPVIPIMPFESDEQALVWANDTEFGLCSSVWSPDKDRAVALARRLEAGYTYLNSHGPMAQDHRAPFGGVKQSGIGRNLGLEGTLDFMEPHSVSSPPGWMFS